MREREGSKEERERRERRECRERRERDEKMAKTPCEASLVCGCYTYHRYY